MTDLLHHGPGSRHRAAEALRGLDARSVLIVTGPRWTEVADGIAAALADRWAGTFAGVTQQVPEPVVAEALQLAQSTRADWVLAIGGGSAIGVAKALALEQPGLKVAALPTTYSGSERTDIWGRLQDGDKLTGRDPRVRPRLVFYDPDLQGRLPPASSRQSLLNALAHSIEALYDASATPAARTAAEESLPLLW